MKCAVACIRSSRTRVVSLSISNSYQPGVFGSKNDTCQFDFVSSSRCASLQDCQNGVGWRIGVCSDSSHLPPGSLSQRRLPMITAEDPFFTWYASRFGATSVHRVNSDCPGPDASQS